MGSFRKRIQEYNEDVRDEQRNLGFFSSTSLRSGVWVLVELELFGPLLGGMARRWLGLVRTEFCLCLSKSLVRIWMSRQEVVHKRVLPSAAGFEQPPH